MIFYQIMHWVCIKTDYIMGDKVVYLTLSMLGKNSTISFSKKIRIAISCKFSQKRDSLHEMTKPIFM